MWITSECIWLGLPYSTKRAQRSSFFVALLYTNWKELYWACKTGGEYVDRNARINEIIGYLSAHGWKPIEANGRGCYGKDETIFVPQRKKKYRLEEIRTILEDKVRQQGYERFSFDSVVNPYSDTDFIIAGIQAVNVFAEKRMLMERRRLYTFQPVIRSVPACKDGCDGFLPCFVNFCLMGLNITMADYFEDLECCVTLLSLCSIHARAIRLEIKRRTNAYDGIGLKLYVGEEEIGQGNLYEYSYEGGSILISDFGFGLERVCWAANGFRLFGTIYQSEVNFALGLGDFSKRLSKIVLMMVSGLKPESSGMGAVLRRQIAAFAQCYAIYDWKNTLRYYYKFWSAFIRPKLMLDRVQILFADELDYQMVQRIAKERGYHITPNRGRLGFETVVRQMLFEHYFDEDK